MFNYQQNPPQKTQKFRYLEPNLKNGYVKCSNCKTIQPIHLTNNNSFSMLCINQNCCHSRIESELYEFYTLISQSSNINEKKLSTETINYEAKLKRLKLKEKDIKLLKDNDLYPQYCTKCKELILSYQYVFNRSVTLKEVLCTCCGKWNDI